MGRAHAIPVISASLIVVLVLLSSVLVTSDNPASSAVAEDTLVSSRADAGPVLDGNVDPVWNDAPALTVPVSGGWAGSLTVSMKSVHDGNNVYFLLRYSDPDKSERRQPWVKNADGSWTKVPAKTPGWSSWSAKDPNAAYEDKLAMIWNINDSIAGFNESGCTVLCHWTGPPQPRKYTNAPGEKGDMWHWKAVRTAPVGQVDDQYVDDCTNVAACDEYGRHSDPKTGGGYSDNKATGVSTPVYSSPTQPAPPYYIMNGEKTPFSDTYSSGDEIAGILVSAITGDRGQIASGSSYDEATHTWTVEIGRALVTPSQTDPSVNSPNDIQFDDLSDEYHFGLAIFDNAQIEHSTSSGGYKMIFADCDQPALQLSRGAVYWASMQDYADGLLSVHMTISNWGDVKANGVQVDGTANTNGVTTQSPLPLGLGDLSTGEYAGFVLKYSVPAGVGSFATTVNAQAADTCGNIYSYPPGS